MIPDEIPAVIRELFPGCPPLDGYDFHYRPGRYWEMPIPSIIGSLRAEHARLRARVALGLSDPVLAAFLDGHPWMTEPLSESTATEQRMLESIDPRYMSGAYLPCLKDWEVEIARMKMNSTLGDVVSFRARPFDNGIAFDVVDEYYDTDSLYDFEPRFSTLPLTLTELVEMIAETVLLDIGGSVRILNIGRNFECSRFLRFSSAFYADLGRLMDLLMGYS